MNYPKFPRKWETVCKEIGHLTQRMRVPGGWLVRTYDQAGVGAFGGRQPTTITSSLVFMPESLGGTDMADWELEREVAT